MIRIFPTVDTLMDGMAELFVLEAKKAIDKHGRFSVALSGGSTPKRLYGMLAQSPWQEQIDWERGHFFWGDERCVPPTDSQSNQRMVREALLNHVPVPESQIHPMFEVMDGTSVDVNAMQYAERYEKMLRQFFADTAATTFDINLLGLGENGHTASLFPHTAVLSPSGQWPDTPWVGSEFIEEVNQTRMTLMADVLNHSAKIIFLLNGDSKADVLQQVVNGPHQPEQLPAQLIHPAHPDSRLLWMVDSSAASRLSGDYPNEEAC